MARIRNMRPRQERLVVTRGANQAGESGCGKTGGTAWRNRLSHQPLADARGSVVLLKS